MSKLNLSCGLTNSACVDKIPVLSCGAVYYVTYKVVLAYESVDVIPKV